MGMTLDEAVEHGKEQLEIFGGEHKEFIECAVETMHKYQKIVQIMERTVDNGTSMYDTLQEIEEVIEDGNDHI